MPVLVATHADVLVVDPDRGTSTASAGLGDRPTCLATEPSEVWRSGAEGATWHEARGLDALPSSSEWAFPPRPETHHVRWIACHPHDAGRLWVAIEAGALISTRVGCVEVDR